MLELIFLPITLIPALLTISLCAGIAYVVVLLFAPLIAWLDAGKECDQKYAFDRWKRAEEYKKLNDSLYNTSEVKPLSRRQQKLLRAEEKKQRKKLQRKETKQIASNSTKS